MKQYFTKSFFKFFFGFLIIIGVAFAVLIGVSSIFPAPIDNIAAPQ